MVVGMRKASAASHQQGERSCLGGMSRGPQIDPSQFQVFSSTAAGEASNGWVEIVAAAAFFGTVVFCALQAMWAPRRTFCAEHMRTD